MLQHLLCALLLTRTAALSVASFLGGRLRLGLLPCTMEDTLQPGETRSLWVFDERLAACLEDAAASHGCVGLLYCTDDSGEATEFSSLLEIESMHTDSLGAWARLRCLARVRLCEVETAPRRYRQARVELYTDDDAQTTLAPAQMARLRAVHDTTAAQRQQLHEMLSLEFEEEDAAAAACAPYIHTSEHLSDAPFGTFAQAGDDELYDDELDSAPDGALVEGVFEWDPLDDDDEGEAVFVGLPFERPGAFGTTFFRCRDHGELDDEENGCDLDQLIETRRAVLASSAGAGGAEGGGAGGGTEEASNDPRAAGSEAAALFAAVRDLWCVESAAAAEAQLLAFAACANLSPPERAEALLMRDGSERVEFAIAALTTQQTQLEKLLVIAEREAMGGGR
jgi:hypothetical protein